jgi:tetratricopeptide (TPR) repeat protein
MAEMIRTRRRHHLGRLAPALLGAALLSAAPAAAATLPAAGVEAPFGAYLAGRHAQQMRDFDVAATWYEKALRADPQAPELIHRTFLMETSEGRFARATVLAASELERDPKDAVAQLVELVARARKGDMAGALALAEQLPRTGVQRFAAPMVLAWTRMANGDLAGAVKALQQFDQYDGFAPLEDFQLALLYDFADEPVKAAAKFREALEVTGQLNWRLTDALANFYARHGRADEAQALYRRFVKQNPGSELAESVIAARRRGMPPPLVTSAADGLAEGLFDLASVVNQPETIDLSLLYDRFALELRPGFALAELLLSDIMANENRPARALAVLAKIPADSPYSWSARLREAADLEVLGRTEEAIAQLKAMASEAPQRAGAETQLGDLLRSRKRYAEAADAYAEAIRRVKAAGQPERWSLFYSLGVSLERSGRWKEAEADLEHALRLKPDQPLVLNYLGYSWIDKGEHLQRALKMIEKAVELRPEDGYIVDSLGWAHYRLGDYASAVEYLEKATELVPEDPTINDHLGDAYWQSGRPVEARYQWQQALQFGPDKDEIKPLESKLVRGLAPPPRAGGG